VGKLHTEELLKVSYSQYNVGAIKLMRMRRVEQLALMGEILNAYFLIISPQIKGSLGVYGPRLGDGIKLSLEIERIVWWIMLKNSDGLLCNTVMNIWIS
jgi:hypothetical protein